MTKPCRYEKASNSPAALWRGRPVFNLYDHDGRWIGRLAADTLGKAEQHARHHAAVPLMEAALRTLSVNPEAAIELHGHPAWKMLRDALRFIDHGPVPPAPAP